MIKTAEQALRIINGGDLSRDTVWDIREILAATAQAVAEVTRRRYYQGLKEGMIGLDSVAMVEFRNQVPEQDSYGDFYLDLPAEPISFGSRWQLGINHIGPDKDLTRSFSLIASTTAPIWANTTNQVNVTKQRVELVGARRLNFLDMKEACPLRIRLFTSDVDENSKVPDDMAPEVIRMVVDLYQNRPRDQKNNTESEPTNMDGDQ